MKHTAPQMATAGGGATINLSSIAGLVGVAGHTLDGASKGAVRTMSKDVAAECAAARSPPGPGTRAVARSAAPRAVPVS
jgi:NAD(P)-dependent dehydrogenase (short-subunit alcohol dehydrogenase family)